MNRPTPSLSSEENLFPARQTKFPSWKGLGVGS